MVTPWKATVAYHSVLIPSDGSPHNALRLPNLEQAQTSLEREIWCFEQADSSELAAKARTHRLSIQFRLNLTSAHHERNTNDQAVVEMKGAQLMAPLAKEGLLYEVLNVFSSIRPFLSTYVNDELERCFVSN